jgi:hypothetical protein
VRITVTCPVCSKRSQIEDKYKGKRLRCPYPDCRAGFRLSEEGEALPVATEEVQEEPRPAVADWQDAPPPRQPREEVYEAPAEEAYEAPVEEAQDEGDVVSEAADDGEESDNGEGGGYDYDLYAPRKKHTARNILIGFIILAGIGGGIAWYLQRGLVGQSIDKVEAQADKEYTGGNFNGAQKIYQDLLRRDPKNGKAPRWELRAKFCEIRSLIPTNKEDLERAFKLIPEFIANYGSGKKKEFTTHYNDIKEDLWATMVAFVNGGSSDAERSLSRPMYEKTLALFEKTRELGGNLRDSESAEKKHNELRNKLTAVQRLIATNEAVKGLIEKLKQLAQDTRPGSVSVEDALQELRAQVKVDPAVGENAEVKALIAQLKANEPNLIKYTQAESKPQAPSAKGPESASLLVCPLLQGAPGAAPADDRVLLALAPGIVYGLAEKSGEQRWATRVGFDTHTAPIRLPSSAGQPELALIMSAEMNTLSAVDTKTGKIKWTNRFDSSCAAGPIFVARKAYVPTKDGKIYEIEIGDGRIHGFYDVGLELTVPGTFDPTSNRLFVPASHSRIYVLNTVNPQEKACAGIIYTEHTVGGLRGLPIVTPATAETPANLVFAEAVGLDMMRIRSFSVPDEVARATESDSLGRPIDANGRVAISNNQFATPVYYEMAGWSWFTPYFDGDNLGIVSDQGVLGLFGLKRGIGMKDKSIFPLVITDRVGERPLGPSQIAHVDLQYWWLLVNGRLERYRFDLYRHRVQRVPGDSLMVGTPLQPGQGILRGRGVALVTQLQERALATSIDASVNKILWQRQLGMVAAQDPLPIAGHLIVMDKKGGILDIEPSHLTVPKEGAWKTGGNWLANGIETSTHAQLLAGPDNAFAVAVIYNPAADRAIVRKIEPGKPMTEVSYLLESAPQGTMAVNSQAVVIPCRDGKLRELPLSGAGKLPTTFNWRDTEFGPQTVGYAAFAEEGHLLVSDGGRKIQQWRRGAPTEPWRKVDDVLEMPARIVAPILIMETDKKERFIVAGDENGAVVQFKAGDLATARQWSLQGKITKGPFARGNRIGCVVDGRKLFMLDGAAERVPDSVSPIYVNTRNDNDMIVGEPRLLGNLLLVAEVASGFTWLDPASGAVKARDGLGLTADDDKSIKIRQRTQTLVTPATGAVQLSAAQAIAPLSDGTFLILTPPGAEAAGDVPSK